MNRCAGPARAAAVPTRSLLLLALALAACCSVPAGADVVWEKQACPTMQWQSCGRAVYLSVGKCGCVAISVVDHTLLAGQPDGRLAVQEMR
eukprot:65009-Chlamydomonas_euryale.AAC.3